MRPPESFVGQPIRSLQTMLQVISLDNNQSIRITPDGIYGPETVKAVSSFQRLHGLPVTGVTNQATWDAVVAAYDTAYVSQNAPQSLNITMNPGEIIHHDQDNPNLCVVQAILHVLGKAYHCLECPGMTGCLDLTTADALTSFQMLCGLPISGCLDHMTWKHLSLHYPLATFLLLRQEKCSG